MIYLCRPDSSGRLYLCFEALFFKCLDTAYLLYEELVSAYTIKPVFSYGTGTRK